MEKTITIDDNIFMLEEDGVYCGAYLGVMNAWGNERIILHETKE